ncbi:substrate-binding domain-containing protein [Gordonia sp. X0973]|uniref:sugar ABC transporter substrate-binding protein n=1 Tax=Gordonia sp. X0973 TaxID=2742602 RepID=UPI000F525978|nr:substrate-binding domain-containing protein [Gordonia sp. X0973]QKT08824.1 substrate-binding domain-containing protein [Gordonia sp. X0973]
MRFGKTLAAASATVLAIGALAGCSSGGSGSGGGSANNSDAVFNSGQIEVLKVHDQINEHLKGKRIAFVPLLYKGYPLTENWGTTLERTANESGAEFKVYDANFSPDRMVSTMNDLIARKAADVIIVQNQAAGLLDNAIEQARKAGIYTIVLNMMTTKLGDAFIGVNVYSAAKAVTERAMSDCQARPDARQLVAIDGSGTDPASVQWAAGVKEAAAAKGFNVTVNHSGFQNPAAQQAAESSIAQHQSKLCGFVVTFDMNAVTVGQTVKTAEQRGTLRPGEVGTYTLDANYQTCDAIKAGTVTATSAYDVQGIGASAAIAMQNLLLGGIKPGGQHNFAFATNTLVDKANVDTTSIACYHSK